MGAKWVQVVALLVCFLACPLGAGVQDLSGIQDLPDAALVLWSCVPCFCPLCRLCLWCIAFEYGSISRFKGVFSAVYGVRVGLCCLGAFCGLWGFCARERLGGLEAWGVFASEFISLLLLLSLFLFSLLVLLSSLFVACSWVSFVWVVVFFSLTDDQTKRKGAILCVLSSLCYPYSNILYIFHLFTSVAFSSTKE